MKDIFYAYFRPSEEDLSELWAGCTFMLDANVLLNLYRYPLEARKDLMGVFKQIADRMWLPHQAALEYQENRLAVMADQVKRYDQVKSILQSTQSSLVSELAKLQLSKRHSSIVTIQDVKQGARGQPWKTLSRAARAGMPCLRIVER